MLRLRHSRHPAARRRNPGTPATGRRGRLIPSPPGDAEACSRRSLFRDAKLVTREIPHKMTPPRRKPDSFRRRVMH
jgi:hypothetical protein